MYKSGVVLAATALCALASVPAAAAIVGGSNVNLSNGPFTFGPVAADQITLSYPSSGLFADTFVSTTGTAQVSSVFGQPSVDFTDGRGGDVIYGPNAFGAYASFATATDIPYSSTDSFLGLRYTVGNNTYYGTPSSPAPTSSATGSRPRPIPPSTPPPRSRSLPPGRC